MKSKLITLALAGMFCTTSAAMAEEAYQGSWYVLPTLGAMHADSELDTDGTDAAYGIRLGKQLSEHWDVQLGVTHAQSDIDLPAGFAGDNEYKQTLIGLDALYMFSRDKFRPFVLAGLGMARNSIDTVDGFSNNIDEDNWSWMANVGVGAQYLFNETVGLQADLRHVWSRAEAPNGSVAPDFHDEETVGNTYFNVGLLINFGAPKKLAAAPEPMPEPVVETPAPVEEPAPAPEPMVEAAPEPQGPDEPAFVKMTLQAEVLFGFDKDVLTSEGKNILDVEVVEKMKAHPEVELVLISGHTDRIGTDQYNQNLSERRANNVKKYLAAQGIEESRLHAVGHGESMPVVDCKGVRGKKLIQCLQPNRRVVVEIEVQRQVAP